MTTDNETRTVLNGTLERVGPDEWRWCNGDPAPQVDDMHPSYNFRVRNYADSSYIEVPKSAVRDNPELAWVREHHQREGLDGDKVDRAHAREQSDIEHKDAPAVYLVPVEVYDRWRDSTIVGAEWDKEDEEQIMSKARALRENSGDLTD